MVMNDAAVRERTDWPMNAREEGERLFTHEMMG